MNHVKVTCYEISPVPVLARHYKKIIEKYTWTAALTAYYEILTSYRKVTRYAHSSLFPSHEDSRLNHFESVAEH